MCGICGVYDWGSTEPFDSALVSRMTLAMAHRGPDDAGVHLSPDRRVGLGFRRLSIVDPTSGGHQPMSNEDDSVWLVCNGEIYDHARHREQLAAAGHVFKGGSDVETLLHLYEEHGIACVERVRGVFSLAVWDQRKKRLLLARDRLGVKPLYYALLPGAIAFASEIKSLLAHAALARAVDEEALLEYLTFLVPPVPRTLFAGVRKLGAGERIVVEGDGSLTHETYWWPLAAGVPESPPASNGVVERVRSLLEDAVRARLMSDVPVGAFLSGGIDSSAIVAMMSLHSPRPVRTFTVAHDDHPASNELAAAAAVARRFGTEHHEVRVEASDMLRYLPELVRTQDEPLADPVCVPLYYLSREAARTGTKVVQVGEGADELFCGYPSYLTYLREAAWNRRLRAVLPGRLLSAGYSAAAGALRFTGRLTGLSGLLERRAMGAEPFWGEAVGYSGTSLSRLLEGRSWWREYAARGVGVGAPSGAVAGLDRLGRMAQVELGHRLPELLLMRLDKVAMSVSVESRLPFLDPALVEFVLPLSDAAKLRGGTKGLLRAAVSPLLPAEVLERPKVGFPAPLRVWFRSIGRAELRRTIAEGSLARRGCFNLGFVETMIEEQDTGRRNWSAPLWILFNLAAWHDCWIEGR